MDLDVKVAALTGVIDVGTPATQARPSCETAEIAARTRNRKLLLSRIVSIILLLCMSSLSSTAKASSCVDDSLSKYWTSGTL